MVALSKRRGNAMSAVGISVEKMIAESRSDLPIITELATVLAKEWCEEWGGWPADQIERMEQIWAMRPAARRLHKTLLKLPKPRRKRFLSAA